jgi:pimeloyl-ACP methyl ester carboxylesterase
MDLFPRQSIWFQNGAIQPAASDRTSPVAARRIVLFVHGYNNDEAKAAKSYRAAKAKLVDVVGRARLDRVWTLFWPGYAEAVLPALRRRITPPLRSTDVPVTEGAALGFLLYALQVEKACKVGRALAEYLVDLATSDPAREIVIVAHSLGCRVALEALAEIAYTPAARQLRAVCLMAAAVATNTVDRGRLATGARAANRTYVLYSRRDTVLRWTFRSGQALAGEGGAWPAVGLAGDPRPVWSSRDETMLRHGEYWPSPFTTPHLARLFGVATEKDLAEFYVFEWSDVPESSLRESLLPENQLLATEVM